MAATTGASPASLKYASLCVLCLQNSLLAILMRLSRVGDHPRFNASTAVVVGEALKVLASLVLIARPWSARQPTTMATTKTTDHRVDGEGGDSRVHAGTLAGAARTILDARELVRMSVPAGLYVVQNNLQYVAASNLDPGAFQVLYQLKILTTAVFSVVLLRKAILPMQWAAIVLLMGGVALVQLEETGSPQVSATQQLQLHQQQQQQQQSTTTGLLAVLAACMCSGFAGVYFEKILKHAGSKTTLWERNVQLGLISIVLGAAGLWWHDRAALATHGFFYGYRPVVWAAIAVSALGGLLTAVVVKYADNILKAFATSIAIILSVIMSIFLFDKVPTTQFVLGAALVNVSVYVYGSAPAWAAAAGRRQPKSTDTSLLPHLHPSRKVAP